MCTAYIGCGGGARVVEIARQTRHLLRSELRIEFAEVELALHFGQLLPRARQLALSYDTSKATQHRFQTEANQIKSSQIKH